MYEIGSILRDSCAKIRGHMLRAAGRPPATGACRSGCGTIYPPSIHLIIHSISAFIKRYNSALGLGSDSQKSTADHPVRGTMAAPFVAPSMDKAKKGWDVSADASRSAEESASAPR